MNSLNRYFDGQNSNQLNTPIVIRLFACIINSEQPNEGEFDYLLIDGLPTQNQSGVSTFSLLRKLAVRDISSEVQHLHQGCKRIITFYNNTCNIVDNGNHMTPIQKSNQVQPNESGNNFNQQQRHNQQLRLEQQLQPQHTQPNQPQHLSQPNLHAHLQDRLPQ